MVKIEAATQSGSQETRGHKKEKKDPRVTLWPPMAKELGPKFEKTEGGENSNIGFPVPRCEIT